MRSIPIILSICFVFSSMALSGQTEPLNKREEMDNQYEKNIRKSRINGVYIPKDIDDAFQEFLQLSPEESLEQFRNAAEESVVSKLHFGIGRWMIVNWSFYEGSRLSHQLRELGLLHPDDMADFLIIVFHRKLNERDLDIDGLVGKFSAKRAKERENMGGIHFDKRKKK